VSFLYYFPNREAPLSRNNFSESDRKAGLDAVLRDATLTVVNPAKGPDDGVGTIAMIARPDSEPNCYFDPKAQTWEKASEHHWIGWWNDKKPTPDKLQRSKVVDGEWVELDGRQWLVPVCGPLTTKLPLAFTLSLEGEWNPEVKEEYRSLMADSERSMDDAENASKEGADHNAILSRHLGFCCKVLCVNYHVGPREVSALRMLTKEAFRSILDAAWGLTTVERVLDAKKTVAVAEAA
jgi:hypothetical protein